MYMINDDKAVPKWLAEDILSYDMNMPTYPNIADSYNYYKNENRIKYLSE